MSLHLPSRQAGGNLGTLGFSLSCFLRNAVTCEFPSRTGCEAVKCTVVYSSRCPSSSQADPAEPQTVLSYELWSVCSGHLWGFIFWLWEAASQRLGRRTGLTSGIFGLWVYSRAKFSPWHFPFNKALAFPFFFSFPFLLGYERSLHVKPNGALAVFH